MPMTKHPSTPIFRWNPDVEDWEPSDFEPYDNYVEIAPGCFSFIDQAHLKTIRGRTLLCFRNPNFPNVWFGHWT